MNFFHAFIADYLRAHVTLRQTSCPLEYRYQRADVLCALSSVDLEGRRWERPHEHYSLVQIRYFLHHILLHVGIYSN